jgi:hypothetical protein
MSEASPEPDADGDDADRKVVELERAELRKFVERLSADDIKSGGWFTKLLQRLRLGPPRSVGTTTSPCG